MNFKDVIGEIELKKDYRKLQCEKIKSHGLPVIILGAAKMAKLLTAELKNFGVEVAGYAVTSEYYREGQNYLGKPVYNYSELHQRPNDYVFILGVADEYKWKLNENRGGVESLSINFVNDKEINGYVCTVNSHETITLQYILQNVDAFTETFNWLGDEISKNSMLAYLKQNVNGETFLNEEIFCRKQYFNDLTKFALNKNSVFVDCGAYDGDTIRNFIECSNGEYKKIWGVEADPLNFDKLKNFVERSNYKDVKIFNCGVWNEKGILSFDGGKSTSSSISEEGSGETSIAVDTIDNLLSGAPVTFIKMDIEGSELKALQGAQESIKKYKPVLAICVYHKAEDLITIPQFIKSLNADYKFYLRKHTFVLPTELVLYALPRR